MAERRQELVGRPGAPAPGRALERREAGDGDVEEAFPHGICEYGFERDALHSSGRHPPIRWWFYLHAENVRPRAPRKGVVDRGFHFARGGRAHFEDHAQAELAEARIRAEAEWRIWMRQPSHALGSDGRLIPLDDVVQER